MNAKQKPVYLDYQATTPLDPSVRTAMMPFLEEHFGNPHSNDHEFGWTAAKAVTKSRQQIADLINADDEEIIFTSGATESCNLALRGVVAQFSNSARKRIVTVSTEHPAVLETVEDLRKLGLDVVILPVSSTGILDLDQFQSVVNGDTLIVSVMAVNNEIGVIQPIREIAQICHTVGAIFHCDATQAPSRLEVDVERWQVDLLSISAHKIYGPKGIGALFVRSGVKIKPIITGGTQERGHRGGTLAPALVTGFGIACERASEQLNEDACRMRELTNYLLQEIQSMIPIIRLFGHPTQRVVGNLNLGIPGVAGEEVARSLARQVAISSGSACSSANSEPSRVLCALGLNMDIAYTSFRISLGRFTTRQEIDDVITAMRNCSLFSSRTNYYVKHTP